MQPVPHWLRALLSCRDGLVEAVSDEEGKEGTPAD